MRSNVAPEPGISDLQCILNNDAAEDPPPVVVFNRPPAGAELVPTLQLLEFDCQAAPQCFVKCRLRTASDTAACSTWRIEYSDNGTFWTPCAALLQLNGWCDTEWPYCGEHRYWRFACDNIHANQRALQENPGLAPPDPPGDGPPAVCPCPEPHPGQGVSRWQSVEWFLPVFGKAYGYYTKPRARLYDVSMKIGEDTIAQCASSQHYPVWVNNVACPSKSTVELPNPPEQLVSQGAPQGSGGGLCTFGGSSEFESVSVPVFPDAPRFQGFWRVRHAQSEAARPGHGLGATVTYTGAEWVGGSEAQKKFVYLKSTSYVGPL